jgi:uncharacterized protein (DUF697 family)
MLHKRRFLEQVRIAPRIARSLVVGISESEFGTCRKAFFREVRNFLIPIATGQRAWAAARTTTFRYVTALESDLFAQTFSVCDPAVPCR